MADGMEGTSPNATAFGSGRTDSHKSEEKVWVPSRIGRWSVCTNAHRVSNMTRLLLSKR